MAKKVTSSGSSSEGSESQRANQDSESVAYVTGANSSRFEAVKGRRKTRWCRTALTTTEPSALAILVIERLTLLGMRQSDFCRTHGFDQGLMSRIQNSVVTNLNLESVLRLAVGLSV